MDTIASYIEYYLPVFIPVFLTIISVLAGIVTQRIKLTLTSLLKIHSDIVIGLFSFVIWALVAFQQSGSVHLNPDLQLSLIRVVLLLFANIILLIAGQIILNIKWAEKMPAAPTGWRPAPESTANGLFLFVTIVAISAPIFLSTAIPKTQPTANRALTEFAIAIPYSDPSLSKHVGPTRWGERLLCHVTTISSADRRTAVEKALADFRSNTKSTQLYTGKGPSLPVFIDTTRIVVEH